MNVLADESHSTIGHQEVCSAPVTASRTGPFRVNAVMRDVERRHDVWRTARPPESLGSSARVQELSSVITKSRSAALCHHAVIGSVR